MLLSELDRLSEAPGALGRLRNFVLELAVSGQLVEQDPSDESAAEIIEQTCHSTHRTRAGTRRAAAERPASAASETNERIPEGWAWIRLGGAIRLVSGQHLKPGEYSGDAADGVPYITGPADFGRDGLVISRYALVRKAVATQGQILLTVKGAGVGKTAVCDLPEVAISRQLMAMSPISWSAQYLLLVTHLLAKRLTQQMRSLIPGISRADVESFAFAMPPLAEQHRIVAKVEEVMTLCYQFEAAQRERELRRDLARSAALNRLTYENETAAMFRGHAQFYLSHVERLLTKPEHVAAVRAAILDLVRWKGNR